MKLIKDKIQIMNHEVENSPDIRGAKSVSAGPHRLDVTWPSHERLHGPPGGIVSFHMPYLQNTLLSRRQRHQLFCFRETPGKRLFDQ